MVEISGRKVMNGWSGKIFERVLPGAKKPPFYQFGLLLFSAGFNPICVRAVSIGCINIMYNCSCCPRAVCRFLK
ncbi:MAG: hypothetical protein AB9861_03350 [Methanosarcina sp.]